MEVLTPEEIAAIVAENKKLKVDIAKKESDLKTAQEVSDEQSAIIETLKGSNPTFKPTVKVGQKTYRILHGVKLEDREYTIADLEKNTSVVTKLFKAQSTAVEEVIED